MSSSSNSWLLMFQGMHGDWDDDDVLSALNPHFRPSLLWYTFFVAVVVIVTVWIFVVIVVSAHRNNISIARIATCRWRLDDTAIRDTSRAIAAWHFARRKISMQRPSGVGIHMWSGPSACRCRNLDPFASSPSIQRDNAVVNASGGSLWCNLASIPIPPSSPSHTVETAHLSNRKASSLWVFSKICRPRIP